MNLLCYPQAHGGGTARPFEIQIKQRACHGPVDRLIPLTAEFTSHRGHSSPGPRLQDWQNRVNMAENPPIIVLLGPTASGKSDLALELARRLSAEILSVELDPYRQRLLNRGLVDGVYVGQALIDSQGVVGQVVRVGPLTSEALLITDADSAVPVTVNRNGLRTIAVGTGDSGRLRLRNITNNANIVVGDVLMSSGLGGVFPAGYPVGRVIEVTLRPEQGFAEVLAEPSSTLDRDREVLLLWDSSEAAPQASEPEASETQPSEPTPDSSVARLP